MKAKAMLLFFIQSIFLFGQNDTAFVSFGDISGYSSFNSFIVNQGDYYVITKYNYLPPNNDVFNSIIKTDLNGEALFQLDTITALGQAVESIVFMGRKNGGFLLFSNVEKTNGKSLFVSLYVDGDLTSSTLIDSIQLPDNEYFLISKGMKYSLEKNIYEGIGTLRNSISLAPTNNYYISADADGYFLNHHEIDISPQPVYLNDFVNLPSSNQYYVSLFNRRSMLLDSTFSQLGTTIPNEFSYQVGDTTVHDLFKLDHCAYNGDNSVVCASIGGIQSEYSLSLFEVNASNSQLALVPPTPLLPTNEYKSLLFAKMTQDKEGDWIIVGTENFTPLNSAVDPNILYILKLSEEGDMIWLNKFSVLYTELNAYDVITDINNDIVIVGDHMSEGFNGTFKNFLLKIGSDGSLTNGPEIPFPFITVHVFPNPADNILTFTSDGLRTDTSGFIYDFHGRLVKTIPINQKRIEIDISNLSKGAYVLVIESEKKGSFSPIKFIKN